MSEDLKGADLTSGLSGVPVMHALERERLLTCFHRTSLG